jgi:endonuclease/exonuclease/phosphatase family metal-dependent hydrolase
MPQSQTELGVSSAMRTPIPTLLILLAFLPGLAGADQELRILTYNIHHGEGTDGVLDLDRIAAIILAERPDIVCMQEVDRGCARTQGLDLPEEFAKRLNMEYRFGPNLDFDGGQYGNCTFSVFPITGSENFSLPFVEGGERRGCLRTELDVNGQKIDVLNTHFDLLPAARKEQAAKTVELCRDVPTILAGDINDTPDGPATAILLTHFRDSHSVARVGESPVRRRIDFVLVSGPLNAVSSAFVATPVARVASDHLPYFARLALPPAPETARDRGIRDNADERIEGAIFPEGK